MYFEPGRAWTFLLISIPLGHKVTRKIKGKKNNPVNQLVKQLDESQY